MRLPHEALVVVCDGRKALLLRNEGGEASPQLRVESTRQAPVNAPTAEQGSDRPGRFQNRAGPTSAVAETDWHELAEQSFAEATVEAIETFHQAHSRPPLVLVAPPKTLAVMRGRLTDAVRASVIAEIDKDLTKHPVDEIERVLTRE